MLEVKGAPSRRLAACLPSPPAHRAMGRRGVGVSTRGSRPRRSCLAYKPAGLCPHPGPPSVSTFPAHPSLSTPPGFVAIPFFGSFLASLSFLLAFLFHTPFPRLLLGLLSASRSLLFSSLDEARPAAGGARDKDKDRAKRSAVRFADKIGTLGGFPASHLWGGSCSCNHHIDKLSPSPSDSFPSHFSPRFLLKRRGR